MPVADWFGEYVVSVVQATRNPGLPHDPTDLFWEVLEKAFVRDGTGRGAAERALFTVAENPPAYADRLRATLIALARTYQTQEANAAAGDGGEMDRETAAGHSRDCPECGGTGLTSREIFSRKYDRRMRVGCICHLCPMGRWTARRHADGREPSRLIDLDNHPTLAAQADVSPDDGLDGLSPGEIWRRVRAGEITRHILDAPAHV